LISLSIFWSVDIRTGREQNMAQVAPDQKPQGLPLVLSLHNLQHCSQAGKLWLGNAESCASSLQRWLIDASPNGNSVLFFGNEGRSVDGMALETRSVPFGFCD
jgi:hypothetical protein